MSKKRNRIIGQDKDISGNLPKQTVKSVIADFKQVYLDLDNKNSPIAGFELIGGKGMTKVAAEEWSNFNNWCDERKLKTSYRTKEQETKIREKLRNREKNRSRNSN